MLDYSTDKNVRVPVVIVLVFVAILTAGALRDVLARASQWLASRLSTDIAPLAEGLSNSVTTTVLIGTYIAIFSYVIWPQIARVSNVLIPNFSGIWRGYIKERKYFDETAEGDRSGVYREKIERMIPVRMDIRQTFFRIGIRFRSEGEIDMSSDATMAAVGFADAQNPQLRHTFARADMVGEVHLALRKDNEVAVVSGRYSSSKQRVGTMELARSGKNTEHFCGEVRVIQGNSGQYIGVSMEPAIVNTYLRQFKRCVGKKRFRRMREKLVQRDGDDQHLTIVEPAEMTNLTNEHVAWINENLAGKKVWIEFMGLGAQRQGDNAAYFVIARSRAAQEARRLVNLTFKHLHVTLGFDVRDINGVEKGEDSLVSVTRERWLRWLRL